MLLADQWASEPLASPAPDRSLRVVPAVHRRRPWTEQHDLPECSAPMSPPRRLVLVSLVALSVSACDQASKFRAVDALTDAFDGSPSILTKLQRFAAMGHPRPTGRAVVIEGYWDHVYVENPGAAFSSFRFLPPRIAQPVLTVFGLIALAFVGFAISRTHDRLTVLALSLILGGALGNLIDRVRLGYVVDFIHWHWLDRFHWPVFNLADAAVSVGIGLLLVFGFDRRPVGVDKTPPDPAVEPSG